MKKVVYILLISMLWTYILYCAYRLVIMHLALKNAYRLRDATIEYGNYLLAKGEREKVENLVKQVCECIQNWSSDVWRIKDILPPQVYFELHPYFYKRRRK